MVQETFKRYEKKYILCEMQYRALLKDLSLHVQADKYGDYTICNIYYDTPFCELIQKSIAKPFYKEKLRLRSYGRAEPDGDVFLEIKKKCDGIVYKRRKKVPLSEAEACIGRGGGFGGSGQIGRELDWFLARYKPEPKVYIAYDREAYVGIEDGRLRITFDRCIRWREDRMDLSQDTEGEALLEPGQMIMEIKIPGSVPIWLARLLSKHKIYPQSFSKYGTYYKQKLLKEKTHVK